MFTNSKIINSKSEFILDQNYVSNYFKNLKFEVNTSFEEFCANSKSINKIDNHYKILRLFYLKYNNINKVKKFHF